MLLGMTLLDKTLEESMDCISGNLDMQHIEEGSKLGDYQLQPQKLTKDLKTQDHLHIGGRNLQITNP